MPLTRRQIRNRIKRLVAEEVRCRISEAGADYLKHEPMELVAVWYDEVCAIADRIYSERED